MIVTNLVLCLIDLIFMFFYVSTRNISTGMSSLVVLNPTTQTCISFSVQVSPFGVTKMPLGGRASGVSK